MNTSLFYISPPLFYISPELKRAIAASITAQEREKTRELLIANMLEIMRDCPDWVTRMEAYDVLVSVLPQHLKPKRWIHNGWSKSDYMPGRWGDN